MRHGLSTPSATGSLGSWWRWAPLALAPLFAMALSGPTPVLITLLAILCVSATARMPVAAIYATLAMSGFGLLFPLVGIDYGLVSTAVAAIMLVAVLSTTCRRAFWSNPRSVALLVGSAGVVGVAATISLGSLPAEQVLQGARIWMLPILAAVVARAASARNRNAIMKTATAIVVISCIAAIFELAIGVEGLIAIGLEYGAEVRTYSGILRAPGLFLTNYEFGAFSGVLGGLALLSLSTKTAKKEKVWLLTAIAFSAFGLMLSWYRGGMVIFFVCAIIMIFSRGEPSEIGRKAFLAATGIALFAFLVSSGFASTESLEARGRNWTKILELYPLTPLGYGIGFAGSASRSRFASDSIVADNYFINLVLQFGPLIALAFIAVLAGIAISALRKSRESPALLTGGVMLGILSAFLVVEFWEYTAATTLAVSVVAIAFEESSQRKDASIEPRRRRSEIRQSSTAIRPWQRPDRAATS